MSVVLGRSEVHSGNHSVESIERRTEARTESQREHLKAQPLEKGSDMA